MERSELGSSNIFAIISTLVSFGINLRFVASDEAGIGVAMVTTALVMLTEVVTVMT